MSSRFGAWAWELADFDAVALGEISQALDRLACAGRRRGVADVQERALLLALTGNAARQAQRRRRAVPVDRDAGQGGRGIVLPIDRLGSTEDPPRKPSQAHARTYRREPGALASVASAPSAEGRDIQTRKTFGEAGARGRYWETLA